MILQLLTSPKTAHRHVAYHRQSKGRWSRCTEDPSIVAAVAAVAAGGALAHAAALSRSGIAQAVRATFLAVLLGFFVTGAVVSVVGWLLANGAISSSSSAEGGGSGGGGGGSGSAAATSSTSTTSATAPSSDEPVELAYCFDVHANAFSAVALLLYCAQVVLLPAVLMNSHSSSSSSFVASLLSNALFAAAAASYSYLSFLGYATLPSVGAERARVALFPGIAAVGISPLLALVRFNPSQFLLGLFF